MTSLDKKLSAARGRGLCRWKKALRLATLIARARKVISPDDSLEIGDINGTPVLKRAAPAASSPENPFRLSPKGNAFHASGGHIRFNGSSSFEVEGKDLSMSYGNYLVIKAGLLCTGTVTVPDFRASFSVPSEIYISSAPELAAVPAAALISSSYVLPGSRNACELIIPIACLELNGSISNYWTTLGRIEITLYHDHWILEF